jgi:hypothetical protein
MLMEETKIMKRLENVDRELHSIMADLKTGKEKPKIAIKKSKPEKPAMSLEELRDAFGKSVKSDVDPTKLIRKMRDRKYDL